MNWTKSFNEQLEADVSQKLRKKFPYIGHDALEEIAEQCKRTVFIEQIREFTARRLRDEWPFLKQNAIAEVAQQCKQAVSDRFALEKPHMEATKRRASMLLLPPEVRNRIFTMVVTIQHSGEGFEGPDGSKLIEHADFEVSTISDSSLSGFCNNGSEDWTTQPAMRRVCWELREETLGIYYGANTFLLHAWDTGFSQFFLVKHRKIVLYSSGTESWLKFIGEKNRGLIKSMIVLNGYRSTTKISGERSAPALATAGVGLPNRAFK